MHFHTVDAYLDTGSRLHHIDPRIKLVTAVLLILQIGLTPVGAFAAYLGFFALTMGGAVIARIDPARVVKRSLVALPFALAAISLLFTVPGPTLATVPLTGWQISEPGMVRFASIIFKSMISVQVAVILILTTHLADMLWALRALHVPKVLVAILSFMYRYVFLMADESLRLTRARDSRSAVIGGNLALGRSLVFRARTTGGMIGNLFLRSFERSERVYQAMAARGYRGELRQLDPPLLSPGDVLFAAITLFLGLVLMLASVLLRFA